jgi:hypothetical protein
MKKQQILDEVHRLDDGSLEHSDSEVYKAWAEMATDWLSEDPMQYLREGFQGFDSRSPARILCDFYLAGAVSDLTAKEFRKLLDLSK